MNDVHIDTTHWNFSVDWGKDQIVVDLRQIFARTVYNKPSGLCAFSPVNRFIVFQVFQVFQDQRLMFHRQVDD